MTRRRSRRMLALLGVLVAVLLPVAPIAIAHAQDPAPRCAVKNFGPTPCPLTVGAGTSDCFVRDPSATDPQTANDFVKADCKDPAFTAPGAIDCSKDASYCDPATRCGQTDANGNAINCDLTVKYINPLIKAVGAMVGLAVAGSIIWAGIEYASSADDPSKVTQAKKRILGAVIALIMYFLFYQFVNWVIPGGIQ